LNEAAGESEAPAVAVYADDLALLDGVEKVLAWFLSSVKVVSRMPPFSQTRRRPSIDLYIAEVSRDQPNWQYSGPPSVPMDMVRRRSIQPALALK